MLKENENSPCIYLIPINMKNFLQPPHLLMNSAYACSAGTFTQLQLPQKNLKEFIKSSNPVQRETFAKYGRMDQLWVINPLETAPIFIVNFK